MIVVTLIALGAALALVRFFTLRYVGDRRFADVVTAGLAVTFAIGYAAHPYRNPASAVSSGDSQVVAVAADVHDVTPDCVKFTGEARDGGSGFVDQLVTGDATARAIKDRGTISAAATYDVIGWATSSDGKHLARAVCLFVDGKVFSKADSQYGLSRPDVAAASNDGSLSPSGYKIVVPAGTLPRGRHHLSVAVISVDGSAGYAHNAWDVAIQ